MLNLWARLSAVHRLLYMAQRVYFSHNAMDSLIIDPIIRDIVDNRRTSSPAERLFAVHGQVFAYPQINSDHIHVSFTHSYRKEIAYPTFKNYWSLHINIYESLLAFHAGQSPLRTGPYQCGYLRPYVTQAGSLLSSTSSLTLYSATSEECLLIYKQKLHKVARKDEYT